MKLTKLNIAPENYECERLNNIPKEVAQHSHMHHVERQFINGLIRMLKPKRILELGVADGAGSAVILNAIEDMRDATLTSFDVREELHNGKKIGFAVELMYPDGNKQWKIYRGEFSREAESFKESFDFVVIDTAHAHPVESFNFLTVFPFLSENAVIVYHDLSLFTLQDTGFKHFPRVGIAATLAYNGIVGDKLKPVDEAYLKHNFGMASMGAVQITKDTKTYLQNIFDTLYFPWGTYDMVEPFIEDWAKIIKKHYSPELFDEFCKAVLANMQFIGNGWKYKSGENVAEALSKASTLIFYGGGQNCRHLLSLLGKTDVKIPDEIWDINAKNLQVDFEIPIVEPRTSFNCYGEKVLIVITIGDKEVSKEVKGNLEKLNMKILEFTDFAAYLQKKNFEEMIKSEIVNIT